MEQIKPRLLLGRALKAAQILNLFALGACAAAAGPEFRADTNPRTGLSQPLPLCSAADPCHHQKGHKVESPSDRPNCATTVSHHKAFNDGKPYQWRDPYNTMRYACIYRPEAASKSSPMPMLLWLHGGLGSAEDVYNHTSLRDKAQSFNLAGGGVQGFILVSVQGRNIHYPTGHPPGSREGRHHDVYYRDLGTQTKNPDIQFLDHLVDMLVAEGYVDRRRIYTMGWSNGGFMAQLYGFARYERSTPGGSHVAAAATFGSANPFHDVVKGMGGKLVPYPKSSVPMILVHRSCDAACACSAKQQQVFDTPPGYALIPWIQTLRSEIGNPNVAYRIIGRDGKAVEQCDDSAWCASRLGLRRGIINHLLWPDGVRDRTGEDWEDDMLRFLGNHPHGR